jgi:hypothetical protein
MLFLKRSDGAPDETKAMTLSEMVAARRAAGLPTSVRVDTPEMVRVPLELANARRRRMGLPIRRVLHLQRPERTSAAD